LNGIKRLVIRLVVDGAELSPSDFIGLFECAEGVSRFITEQEAGNLFAYLNVPSDIALENLRRFHRLSSRQPSLAEVGNIEKGSWLVEVVLWGSAVFILKQYLHPAIKQGWEESRLRQLIMEFVRDKIFLGTKRDIETHVTRKPRYQNLLVTRVGELKEVSEEQVQIEIHLTKQFVLEPRPSDKRLIEEFIEKLKK
jgi:hypothetical protein